MSSQLISKTELDELLIKLIQAGDCIETEGGINPAVSPVSERFGTRYYHAIVSVDTGKFLIPIHSYSIRAVWRNGVCIWRLGESTVQRRLFE